MPRPVIIGGSLSGLFAGMLLRSIGWDTCIFERSPHELDNRGGGIVFQPDVIEAFHRARVPYDTSIGVIAKERVYSTRMAASANASGCNRSSPPGARSTGRCVPPSRASATARRRHS